MYMSEFTNTNNIEEIDERLIKKPKIDTEEKPINPYMNLSLTHPDEIKEDFTSYEPQHKTGEKFTMNDKELMIRQITRGYDPNKETFLKKYVFVPSSIEKLPGVYMDSAYDIDKMIDMKSIRDRKGQPHGGKYKSRRRRRHRKSKKSKKSRK
jgi:hypothetical protein